MWVVFRVDASISMGIGHVMRCLALANELKNLGAKTTFITREHYRYGPALMQAQGHEVQLLPALKNTAKKNQRPAADTRRSRTAWQQDAAETQKILGSGRPDWLVVDHYALDAYWHKKLRKQVGKICIIDDLADRPIDGDLLLDQTYSRRAGDYQHCWTRKCRTLLGSRYALLHSEFAALRTKAIERRKHFSGIYRILVTFGGTDPDNITSTALEGLAQIDWHEPLHVDVVLSGGAPHLTSIQQQAIEHPLNVTVSSNVIDMAERILQADLAIGAAGTTSWERCCLGLPTLITACAENQQKTCQDLVAAGAALLISDVNHLTRNSVADSVKKIFHSPNMWKQMSKAALKIADGLGAKRAALELAPIYAHDGQPIRLRPITVEDTEILYKWQSDPKTRRFSHNPNPPAYIEHVNWVKRQVNTISAFTEIIMHGETAAGVIRLDPIEDSNKPAYLISIYISPDKYRLGIATAALEIAGHMVPKATLRAEVLEKNRASHALFTKAGFQHIGKRHYEKTVNS